MTAKVNKKIKFPENVRVKKSLKHGDVRLLAQNSRYTYRTIYDILSGYRAMPDSLATQITELLESRKEIFEKLDKVIQNN